MFVFAAKWFTLFIVFVVVLNAHYQVSADDGLKPPAPIATTNVSTVTVGSAFTMKCEMPANYTIGNEFFDVYFYYNINSIIGTFELPASSTTETKKRIFYANLNNGDKPYIASIEQVNSTAFPTSNTFEVIITTAKRAYSAQFFCYSSYNHFQSDVSNLVPVTVTDTFPPTLTSSVHQVYLYQPFTLTCSLPEKFHFTTAYQVAFFNSRDGLLADYEVEESGRVDLVSREHTNVSAHLGTRAAYPTFDLEVQERANRKLSYWCKLITNKTNVSLESLHWKPAGPFVDFSASTSGSEHRGRCNLEDLPNVSEREYQVLFYSNLGLRTDEAAVLGFFWVRPHRIIEFVTETVTHWASIVHGANINYPTFEIVGQLESGTVSNSSSKWWCSLNFTEPGQTQTVQIKSNLEGLQ